MRRTRTLLAATLGAALLAAAGCGSDDAAEVTTGLTDTEGAAETLEDVTEEAGDVLPDALTLDLVEQNDSGISGEVELSPTSEGQVEVEIEVDGSDGGPHPAHIHAGTCADLDPTPEFPLEDVVDGRSETTVEVSPTDLFAGSYAVNVHESAENVDVYVACADLLNQ
jgi:oxalate decarboxylase/phosphoglucose isomerase-like protein (cupin superfamily)